MRHINKIHISNGISYLEIPEANLYILCGCPADAFKHLGRAGVIKSIEDSGTTYETGPNCILLSDIQIQNGELSNLSEFPILHMLYKQGMILPNHPGNTGAKPILIGIEDQVEAQMAYIHRGNYGLVSQEEIEACGIPQHQAKEMMDMKLAFAFGSLKRSEHMLDKRIIADQKIEIKNEAFVERLEFNKFRISYRDQHADVDLNLPSCSSFGVPYELGYFNAKRDFFSIIHSGEGDGWDVHRPCMASILIHNGELYLIDAGPNLIGTLTALGIGITEIKGIFHTHAHDDHFAGLTTLIQSEKRIKYYATSIVRASVAKKLSALMSVPEEMFEKFFSVHDLQLNAWNDVDGLEVYPGFSPHPVETTFFKFRILWENGHKIYSHLADTVSLDTLEKMIRKDPSTPGITKDLFERVKAEYLEKATIKKIDIGGGLIHGNAIDFRGDESEKIVLAHKSEELTDEEKEIGSTAPFGMVEVLIPTNQNQVIRYAKTLLHAYFPSVPFEGLKGLLNCPAIEFGAGSILIKQGIRTDHIFLILTGAVEVLQSKAGIRHNVYSGALIGEYDALVDEKVPCTYRAKSYVTALRISSRIYHHFITKYQLGKQILDLHERKNFLRSCPLFEGVTESAVLNKIALSMEKVVAQVSQKSIKMTSPKLLMLAENDLEYWFKGVHLGTLSPKESAFEDMILNESSISEIELTFRDDEVTYYTIPSNVLSEIPVIQWKILEIIERRTNQVSAKEQHLSA